MAEIAALKKEVARLRAERDILKKASHVRHWFEHHGERFFRARGDMRFAFIPRPRYIWPVRWLGQVPEVSRSGFLA